MSNMLDQFFTISESSYYPMGWEPFGLDLLFPEWEMLATIFCQKRIEKYLNKEEEEIYEYLYPKIATIRPDENTENM